MQTYASMQQLLGDLSQDIKLIFETEFATPLPDYYSNYAHKMTANEVRIWHSIVGLGMPQRTGEMELPKPDSPQAGRVAKGVATTYQISTMFSNKAKNSPTGKLVIPRVAGMVRRGFKELMEYQAVDIWTRGFIAPASGGVGSPDGLSLFNTAHTTIRGSKTWPNTPSTVVTLSNAGLQLARAQRHRIYDDTGYRATRPDLTRLIVLPDNEQLAFELTQSDLKPGQFAGGTQPNDRNWHQNVFKAEVWKYMDSSPYPNSWWLSEPTSQDYSLKLLMREEINDRQDTDIGRDAVINYSRGSWFWMVDHPLSVWGSKGS